MAAAQVTPDNNAVTAEVLIAAPPDRVFQALTDPAQMPKWWGQKGMYRISECQSDLRVGGKWSSVGVGDDGTSFRVDGEYLEVDRPRLLVYTWRASFAGPLTTTVRVELDAAMFTACSMRGRNGLEPGHPLRFVTTDSPATWESQRATAMAGSECLGGCRHSWKPGRRWIRDKLPNGKFGMREGSFPPAFHFSLRNGFGARFPLIHISNLGL